MSWLSSYVNPAAKRLCMLQPVRMRRVSRPVPAVLFRSQCRPATAGELSRLPEVEDEVSVLWHYVARSYARWCRDKCYVTIEKVLAGVWRGVVFRVGGPAEGTQYRDRN